MSSCVKQGWIVMLIKFCLLHLQYLGSLRWLSATAYSERATSSLSGAGGNLLHTSNWTKCLSNSEPSRTDQLCADQVSTEVFHLSVSPSRSLWRLFGCRSGFFHALCLLFNSLPLHAQSMTTLVLPINYKKGSLSIWLRSLCILGSKTRRDQDFQMIPTQFHVTVWSSSVSSREAFAAVIRRMWGYRRVHRGL